MRRNSRSQLTRLNEIHVCSRRKSHDIICTQDCKSRSAQRVADLDFSARVADLDFFAAGNRTSHSFGRFPRRLCGLRCAWEQDHCQKHAHRRAQDDHDASHSCRLQRGGPGGGDLPGVLRTEQPSSRRRSDQQRGVRGVQACGVRRVRRNADTGRSCAVPDVQGTAPTASAAVQHVSKVPRLCSALARLLRLLRARLAALDGSRHPRRNAGPQGTQPLP